MQLIPNGPDIPDSLLQLHEDGRVVFFCGAGISYPAGLPGFKGLVDKVYEKLGTTKEPNEQSAFDREQYDVVLDLLERRLPGRREGLAVRKALAGVLAPKLRRKGAKETHAALLQLARSREGALRLVTTNFDRIFEQVGKGPGASFNKYVAPMLPIPKKSRWDGLVYLHGLLPHGKDDAALQGLVFTSGDFGLAYLVERWAARFVTALLQNYVVCFVGYSINDPVMRYIMDALAADRMLGETSPRAYAFGSCEPGKERDETELWKSKGVTPILYNVPSGTHDHSALHNTLRNWAELNRDGFMGKAHLVMELSATHPTASTQQDDFVGRMIWALADPTGIPARTFAEYNPVPTLDWLKEFSKKRFIHTDLNRFGIPPCDEIDETLSFSLVNRPTPYKLAPWMSLFTGRSAGEWDIRMRHLADWLLRHLNDPELILWLVKKGGRLHPSLQQLIKYKLDEIVGLQQSGKKKELAEIIEKSPSAIPNPPMYALWRFLLLGCVKYSGDDESLYDWLVQLNRVGLTTLLRLQLRQLLKPMLSLNKLFRWPKEVDASIENSNNMLLVDCELVLAADHVYSALANIKHEHWHEALPELLREFQQLLLDALDMLRELGKVDEHHDQSFLHLPSISRHSQNQGFHDWTILIELLRDAWLAVREKDPALAAHIAANWFEVPYPTFKRLALFAASQDACIAPSQWVDWLMADRMWCLWSLETKRETIRLLVLQGQHLEEQSQKRLEQALLGGLPREMFLDDLTHEEWEKLVARAVWFRLSKLESSGIVLGSTAKEHLQHLSLSYPQWELADDESDEFSIWMSSDYESNQRDLQRRAVPRKRRDIVQWLRQPAQIDDEDAWREACRTHYYACALALCELAREKSWPRAHWREVLASGSEEKRARRSWCILAPVVHTMPDEVLRTLLHSIPFWLQATSKVFDRHDTIFWELCDRFLQLPLESASGMTREGEPLRQPLTEALNHPIGHVTQALLHFWFREELQDGGLLPDDIALRFTTLCDPSVERYRHGRVLLASRLVTLFRVDHSWTEQHLLPLFNWSTNPEEARFVWEGFLWSPRLYSPLMALLKPSFLETASHYDDLRQNGSHYASLITYAALNKIESYSSEDFQRTLSALPQTGLEEAAHTLSRAQKGAEEQREEHWKNRVLPFLRDVWPKENRRGSKHIAAAFANLAIDAGNEFPAALNAVRHWLQPIEYPDDVVDKLEESKLCSTAPKEVLKMLNLIIKDQFWAPRSLGKCLTAIVAADSALEAKPEYKRLHEYGLKKNVI